LQPGTYVVNLVVTDSANRTGAHNTSLTVVLAQPNVIVTVSPSAPVHLTTNVSFNTDQTTYYPGSGASSFSWSFGDGTSCSTAVPAGCGTGTPADPAHIYATAGTYTATVSVTDTKGRTGVATVSVPVS
jgi:PKD repeat protein